CLSYETASLSHFNVNALAETCRLMGISFEPIFASESGFLHRDDADACEKVLDMCRHLGATEYLNPAGAAALYDENRFHTANVELQIHRYEPIIYECGSLQFEPALSILDTLMWVGI